MRWTPLDHTIHCPHINAKVTMTILSRHIIGTDSYMLKEVLGSSCHIYSCCSAKDEKGRCPGYVEAERIMRRVYKESIYPEFYGLKTLYPNN